MKTKIHSVLTWQRIAAFAALCGLIMFSIGQRSVAQTLTQGYDSDQSLQRGMIVKLKKDDPSKIEASSQFTASETIGVVVGANESPLTLSEEGEQYYVASTSEYDVLASTQQGPIKRGDYITVSSIDGIGMRASQDDDTVIGIALSDFDGSRDVASTPTITDASGEEKQYAVGRVSMDVAIGRNPNYKVPEPDVPTALRKFTEAVAGKPLSVARIAIALVVVILTASVAGSVIYGGVRSGIISIGRNPLSKKNIVRGMLQVIFTGLIIFIAGLFGVYLILRL